MVRRTTMVVLAATLVLAGALASARSVRVTSEELHRRGGVPPGWTFAVPPGDPAKGKEVFAALECYACHEVEGAGFPPKASDKSGPNLTRMGRRHPAEYFAESILDPDAVIIDAPGFYGDDGRSTMPSYSDVLTLQQWVDVVTYLKTLDGEGGQAGHGAPGAGHGDHGGGQAGGHDAGARETREHHRGDGHATHDGDDGTRTSGAYRVRLDWAEPERAGRPGTLSVWVADAASGQPVPYLPVRVRIGAGRGARTVTLAPVLGAEGPHYGAAVTIPDETETVTVLIGAATARVAGVEPGRYRTPRQVPFDW